MIKIGMLIADRYEVLEKVGTGGMSDVYKAKDHRLNRMVAVVYDVGEEKGTYFIIMELVNGITLKRYIEKRKRLSTREAVTVAIQVAMGLAAAHRGHIIHRDIKPQNIIISKEGKVKVTDFGIAKASTSNTITSNVMGSVHYTSPEQARGGYSDEKSDVYSLGVTLYEMLTGKVPYDGETTVAIALQHIQDPFPSPREAVPDLPFSVEQIVLKCCEKSPDRRYQTMDELASDLRHSLNDPDGNFVQRAADKDLTETRAMSSKERDEIRRKTSAAAGEAAQAAAAAGTGSISQATQGFQPVSGSASEAGRGEWPAGSAGGNVNGDTGKVGEGLYPSENDPDRDDYTGADEDDQELAEDERRLDRIIQILSIVAVIVIGFVIILVAVNRRASADKEAGKEAEQIETQTPDDQNQDTQEPEETVQMAVMPKVIGKTVEDAQDALKRANLTWDVTYGTSDVYEEGIVMDATAKEGDRLEEGTQVTLTVAMVKKVVVTDVTGKKQADAEKELAQLGLKTSIEEVFSQEVQEGYVENQDPGQGVEVASGATVILYVSQGPDLTGMVEVPNILGLTEQEASAALLQVGLTPGETTVTDTSGRYDPGIVIGQSIEKGQYVEEGTKVDMELSGDPRYSYSARIEAPRYSEDPDYEEGTPVTLIIRADDGKELLNVTTSEFPYQVSFTGIPYSEATLYLKYTNVTIEYSETGETGAAPEATEHKEKKELTRKLVFTKD